VRDGGEDQALEVGQRLRERLGGRGRPRREGDAQLTGPDPREYRKGLRVGQVAGDPVDQPVPFAPEVF
jgi:hypothetical protein